MSEVEPTLPPCPSCGHRVIATDKYCSECGFPIGSVDSKGHDQDVLLGKSLPGGYRIVEFIAEGSMGRVYRAEQANLGRSVAVKIMNSALLSHPKMVDRFRTEARAASMLNHPNCTRVYDFGETPDKRPYIVMELLIGKDLELILRDEPFLPVTRALDIAQQILHALEEAHGQGIVHRDLKPANVFVMTQRGGGDLVKVVDFGLAKLRSAISGSTMTGIICGTPAYMAPEQATAADTDGRTDLYALGVMLFEMLAGRPPFAADDPTTLLKMQVYDEPPSLAAVAPDRCPRGINELVAKLLAKNPADRYPSANEVAQALGDILLARTGERGRPFMRGALKACQECGGLFPSNARFCGECGAPAPRDSLPFPISPSISPPPLPHRAESHPSGIKLSERAARISEKPPSNDRVSAPLPRIDEEDVAQTGPRRPLSPSAFPSRPKSDPPKRRSDPRTDEQDRRTLEREEDTGPHRFDRRSSQGQTQPRSPLPAPAAKPPAVSPRNRRRASTTAAVASNLPASLQLVELESKAATLTQRGDLRGAVATLERAVLVIRGDMDRGELDDPIGAMALFLGKLGEANVEIGEYARALELLKESVSLMSPGAERVRLLLVMSRAARELGRDRESARYLDEAESEASERPFEARDLRHPSIAPASGETDRVSGVTFDHRAERSSAPPAKLPPKKLSR
ncbi:MAG: protein kinase [Polyangiaceae bacterium]